MSALLRIFARLVTLALLVALSLCGLAIALFAIGWTASGDFNLPGLAKLVHLPQLRTDVGDLLRRLEASGSVAGVAALCGLGALVIGLVLLLGIAFGRRGRLAILEKNDDGILAARPRVLGRVAGAMAEQARGVTATKVKVRVGRRGAVRIGVQASHSRADRPQEVQTQTSAALAPLTETFQIRAQVHPKVAKHEPRVQ
jgi:hypothetical protein